MARWSKALTLSLIGIGLILVLGEVFTNLKHQVDARALEREIRDGLPVGSSISTVEVFLKERGIGFYFDTSSKTGYAIARRTKGSALIIREDLALKFHFGDSSKLESIDAKVDYTGP